MITFLYSSFALFVMLLLFEFGHMRASIECERSGRASTCDPPPPSHQIPFGGFAGGGGAGGKRHVPHAATLPSRCRYAVVYGFVCLPPAQLCDVMEWECSADPENLPLPIRREGEKSGIRRTSSWGDVTASMQWWTHVTLGLKCHARSMTTARGGSQWRHIMIDTPLKSSKEKGEVDGSGTQMNPSLKIIALREKWNNRKTVQYDMFQ